MVHEEFESLLTKWPLSISVHFNSIKATSTILINTSIFTLLHLKLFEISVSLSCNHLTNLFASPCLQSVSSEALGGVMKTAVVNTGPPSTTGLTTVTVNPGSLAAGSLTQAAVAPQAATHQTTKYVVVSAPNQPTIKTEIKEEPDTQPMDLTWSIFTHFFILFIHLRLYCRFYSKFTYQRDFSLSI